MDRYDLAINAFVNINILIAALVLALSMLVFGCFDYIIRKYVPVFVGPQWLFEKLDSDAVYLGVFILVSDKHKNNEGLILHEKDHAVLFIKYLIVFPLALMVFRKYRLYVEMRAYAVQVNYDKGGTDWAVRLLHKKYGSDYTEKEIRFMFRGMVNVRQ